MRIAPSDRRRHNRLDIRWPMELRWEDPAGRPHVLRIRSRNVSSGGVYFESPTNDLLPGQLFEVEFFIPPAEGVHAFESHARARAQVMRVSEIRPRAPGGSTRFGFGARLRDRFRFDV